MKIFALAALAVAITFAPIPTLAMASIDQPFSLHSTTNGGRKTVTVYADSESEASSLAESQNSGWRAVSVKKVNPKDPLSRMYSVTMEK